MMLNKEKNDVFYHQTKYFIGSFYFSTLCHLKGFQATCEKFCNIRAVVSNRCWFEAPSLNIIFFAKKMWSEMITEYYFNIIESNTDFVCLFEKCFSAFLPNFFGGSPHMLLATRLKTPALKTFIILNIFFTFNP